MDNTGHNNALLLGIGKAVTRLQKNLEVSRNYQKLLRNKEGGTLSEQGNAYLEKIADQTRKMQRLVTDMLNFASLESEAIQLQWVDLEQLMVTIRNSERERFENKGAHLEIRELPLIMAHRPHMIKLFTYLLDNALTYHAEGVKPRIIVWSEEDRGWTKIFVQDNGIGISEEDQENVFRPFTRSNTTGYEGTGMGLAICRQIVLRHKGLMSMESTPGKGTTIIISLPLQNSL